MTRARRLMEGKPKLVLSLGAAAVAGKAGRNASPPREGGFSSESFKDRAVRGVHTAEGGELHDWIVQGIVRDQEGTKEEKLADCSGLAQMLRPEHTDYPLWATPDLMIYFENWDHAAAGCSAKAVSGDLLKIAEPRSRPDLVHTYEITPASLHTATNGNNLQTDDILAILRKYCKFEDLPPQVIRFVKECSDMYCKARLLLRAGNHYVVSDTEKLLRSLLDKSEAIRSKRVPDEHARKETFEQISVVPEGKGRQVGGKGAAGPAQRRFGAAEGEAEPTSLRPWPPEFMPPDWGHYDFILPKTQIDDEMAEKARRGGGGGGGDDDEEGGLRAPKNKLPCFKVKQGRGDVEKVRKAAWDIHTPLVEEYDFGRDTVNTQIMVKKQHGSKQSAAAAAAMGGGNSNAKDVEPYRIRDKWADKHRDYQKEALDRMFGAHNKVRSGIVVLPCGAGKTFVGISAAQRIGRSCIVVCNNTAAVNQWKRAFMDFTNIDSRDVVVFHSESKPERLPNPCVLITTYPILMESKKSRGGYETDRTDVGVSAAATQRTLAAIRGAGGDYQREWALMVLDEVHMAAANCFRTVMEAAKCHCKLGLTATLVREDMKISELYYLIGPRLYEANWTELAAAGHLSTVQCAEVWCPMSRDFMAAYYAQESARREADNKAALAMMNPTKFRAAEFLLEKHQRRRDKILLFSDDIFTLDTYCSKLQIPRVYGATAQDEREFWLGCFRGDYWPLFALFCFRERHDYGSWADAVNLATNKNPEADPMNLKLHELFKYKWVTEPRDSWDPKYLVSTIALSRVGDVAIDLPDANVLIQVTGDGGGRRQEAQRMGRILRRKSEGTSNEANFYSLISRDTTEMKFGQRRQRYLVDQGYNYQVLLADQLLAGWASTELPEGSEAEREMLEATKASINREAKGSSVGGASEQRKRAKKNHQQKQHQHQNQQQASDRVTATRYTQSGRYNLDKFKSKKRRQTQDATNAKKKRELEAQAATIFNTATGF